MNYDFSAYKDLPVLLTGASGFSGGHLAQRLLDLGARLTLLARDADNRQIQGFIRQGARVVTGDVRQPEKVKEACSGQQLIFHVAALFREAKFEDQVYFDVNLQGSKNIFEAAQEAGARRVIHCSTNGVHGTIDNPPGNEDSPIRPGDVYQESKWETELEIQRRVNELGQDIVIIRPAMIWGEGDTRFLKMFKAISKKRFPIIGTGKTLCHWLHIQDLVDAFLLAGISADARGRAYLIAGTEIVTLEQTAQMIAEKAGVKMLPFKIPAFPIQLLGSIVEKFCVPFGIEPPLHRRRVDFFVKNRAFDISRAKAELGYNPVMKVKEQVSRIFDWYQKNGWL